MTEKHGFELVRDEQIAEINTRARLYQHIKTGAELLSLENEDENKVFGINFRTPPTDSTGLPHIMEHAVLCGSRKYPVKEPFVELVKGSLNTFLNAMTYPDKTCYPVASTNLQDFYNLVDVYLDAVFFPTISAYTLAQEGWHYEAEDPSQPLTYKGVVFNEMKGAYSSPEDVLGDYVQHHLFPDTSYRHFYGGDPRSIPDLTYQQFKTFHETFYHPSNARVFFYGDDDPERRLAIMDEYLSQFDARQVDTRIALQVHFGQPRRAVVPYEVAEDPEDAKAYVTMNWLLPETGDPELAFALAVLEYVLIGTPAAQLRRALIDSGLGEDLTGRGLETEYRQSFFSTGLKGVALENVDKVESLIQDTIRRLAQEGIDPDNVAAALNTIEFRLRENNTGSFPRGLSLMLRSLQFWNYDKDPLAPLAFEKPLQAIKARLNGGDRYLEALIDTHLVNNPHRTTVILTPDPELSEKRAAEERGRLDRERAQMTDADVLRMIEDAGELKRRQETPDSPEALATIPMLKKEDLEKEVRRIPMEQIESGSRTILFHDLFTNGILYLDLGFNLRALPQELLPYVSLFGRALTETGTKQQNFVQLLQRIGRGTGGIRRATITSTVRGKDEPVSWLFLRGKAMPHQAAELLAILRDVLTGANLDDQARFRQMALEEKAGLESSVVEMGHAVINTRLKARFTRADWASEQMGGVTYLYFLRDLIQRIDQDWPSVQKALETIRAALLTGPNAVCNITIDAANFQTLRPQIEDFLSGLPDGKASLQEWGLPDLPAREGLTIPAQVNYVGKGANLYQMGYQLNGSAFVISNYVRGTWMWEKIRVQGGAYGGFCAFDSQSGAFNYLSYRDPNLLQSLQNYDETPRFLMALELNEQELTKSIIGTIGDLDAYMLPDAKGFTSMRWHLLGITDSERQALREQVLDTSLEDFRRFAGVLERVREEGAVVVLGVEEAIRAAGIFEDVKKVL